MGPLKSAPYETAARFVRHWSEAGGNANVEPFEGEPHGFAYRPGPAQDRAMAVMKAFIQRRLALRVAA